MMTASSCLLKCLTAAVVCAGSNVGAESQDGSDWQSVLQNKAAEIQPTVDERRWMEIPWFRTAAAAVEEAKAEHRLIFVFSVAASDPLGRCSQAGWQVRSDWLGYEQAAKKIGDHFVPLAVTRTQLSEIKRELSWEVDASTTYAFHVIAPTGRLVASALPDRTSGVGWSKPLAYGQDLAEFLDGVLENPSALEPRKAARPSAEEIGVGLQSDGSAHLSVCVRQRGKHAVSGKDNWGKWPMFDAIELTPDQLRTMAPIEVKKGAQYDLPEPTARQFAAVLTLDSTSACKIDPEDVTQAKLTGEVTNVAGDIIEVRLAGAISGEGKEITVSGTGEFEGRLVFNRRGELQELLVLYEGTYQGGLIDRFNGNEGTSLEGIVQWRRSVEKTPENEN